MKRTLTLVFTIVVAGACACRGQVGGNVGYAQAGGKARAEQSDRAGRTLNQNDLPPTRTSSFVEASVLMNVKADEYVAVFGIVQEAENLAECGRKMDATVKEFSDGVKALGVAVYDFFVDFVAQNKVYGFEVTGDIAREKLVGFELKKNVAIHYKDRDLLDKLVLVAARSRIFDLIKVDSVVKDTERIQDRLADEAAKIIKRKTARTEKLLGIKLQPPAQVYAEKFSVHYPTDLYDSYTAYESEEMGAAVVRQKYTTQSARKSRTFFFNGLNGDGFDAVIGAVVIEPVVQFTLYLKIKYEVEQDKAK